MSHVFAEDEEEDFDEEGEDEEPEGEDEFADDGHDEL